MVTLYAEQIYHLGSFPITNALLTSWFAVIILIVLAVVLRKKSKEISSPISRSVLYSVQDEEGKPCHCIGETGNRF